VLLGKRNGQQTQLGILLPQRRAVALRLLYVLLPLGEVAVGIGKQPLDAVLELALLVVEIESIRDVSEAPRGELVEPRSRGFGASFDRLRTRSGVRSDQNPSTALARMLR
jgi:hypothetical protein